MRYILDYLLKQSLMVLAVFVYGVIVGFFLLWGAGFLNKNNNGKRI